LGEYIPELGKNILYLSDFLKEVWKKRDMFLKDPQKSESDWLEKKVFLLNSRILEHIITSSLTSSNKEDIKRLKNGFKGASGKVKMKILKTIVEKLGCQEQDCYYLGNNGNNFYRVPSREFFRKNYDDIKVKFDYHTKINGRLNSEEGDFLIKLRIGMDGYTLLKCNVYVGFTGGDISSKLTAKYKFEIPPDFNFRIHKKSTNNDEVS